MKTLQLMSKTIIIVHLSLEFQFHVLRFECLRVLSQESILSKENQMHDVPYVVLQTSFLARLLCYIK